MAFNDFTDGETCPRCGNPTIMPGEYRVSKHNGRTRICTTCADEETLLVHPWPGYPGPLDATKIKYRQPGEGRDPKRPRRRRLKTLREEPSHGPYEEIEWRSPPIAREGGTSRRGMLPESVRQQLRDNPDEWAAVGSQKSASSVAHYRSGYSPAGYDIVARPAPNGNGFEIFARYHPDTAPGYDPDEDAEDKALIEAVLEQ